MCTWVRIVWNIFALVLICNPTISKGQLILRLKIQGGTLWEISLERYLRTHANNCLLCIGCTSRVPPYSLVECTSRPGICIVLFDKSTLWWQILCDSPEFHLELGSHWSYHHPVCHIGRRCCSSKYVVHTKLYWSYHPRVPRVQNQSQVSEINAQGISIGHCSVDLTTSVRIYTKFSISIWSVYAQMLS